jgi:heme/copper-type cytochrome/quinol oxidase subunit 4
MNPQQPTGPTNPLYQPPQPSPAPDEADQLDQPDKSVNLKVRNPLSVMQPGEQIICEIRRHPIGMLGTYIASGFILIVLAILAFIVLPHAAGTDNHTQVIAAAGLAFVILTVIILLFVFIANKVYWGNHWVVTSDSITQITQTSLFSRQSAQLSLGNLEDVTSEQNGILAQMFKFGSLRAETAGERSKFVFPFCPNPNYYAQKILAAREVFEQAHHGGKQEPYVAAPAPAAPTYQYPTAPSQPAPSGQPAPGPGFGQPSLPASDSDAPQYQIGQTPPDFNNPPEIPASFPQPQFPASPTTPAGGQPADLNANQPYDNLYPPEQN